MPTAEDGGKVPAGYYGQTKGAQKKKAPAKKKTEKQKSSSSSSGFNESSVTRAPAGSPAGGQFAPGKARDSKAAEAQKDQGSYKKLTAGGDPAKLSDKDLEQASRVAYSWKSSDPKVVALRIKIANAMSKRGKDVKAFGALGGGTKKKAPAKKKTATKTAAKKKK